jgi:isocitrate dehydrogenase
MKLKVQRAKHEKGVPVGEEEQLEACMLERKLKKKVVMMSEFESKKQRRRKRKNNTENNAQKVRIIEEGKIDKVDDWNSDDAKVIIDEPLENKNNEELVKFDEKVEEHTNKKHKIDRKKTLKHNPGTEKFKFLYKKNTIYSDLHRKDKDDELSVLLQWFRYIVKQKLIP